MNWIIYGCKIYEFCSLWLNKLRKKSFLDLLSLSLDSLGFHVVTWIRIYGSSRRLRAARLDKRELNSSSRKKTKLWQKFLIWNFYAKSGNVDYINLIVESVESEKTTTNDTKFCSLAWTLIFPISELSLLLLVFFGRDCHGRSQSKHTQPLSIAIVHRLSVTMMEYKNPFPHGREEKKVTKREKITFMFHGRRSESKWRCDDINQELRPGRRAIKNGLTSIRAWTRERESFPSIFIFHYRCQHKFHSRQRANLHLFLWLIKKAKIDRSSFSAASTNERGKKSVWTFAQLKTHKMLRRGKN